MATRRKFTVNKQSQIKAALRRKPHSYAELSVLADINQAVVRKFVVGLRAEKQVHVAASERPGEGISGPNVLKFAWGDLPDAPPPAPTTAAERMAKTRRNRKEN